ncbi:SH3 domain protein [Cooperia oncophora]
MNGSWGTAAQPVSSETNSSESRYCLDFTERNSGYGAAKSLSPSGAAGFAVKAIYDYTAADKDEVSFLEGDVIVNCEKVDDGWMTGTVQRTLQWGMLPANYVQPHKLPTGLARFK